MFGTSFMSIVRKTILYMQPCIVRFSCIYTSRLAVWRMCSVSSTSFKLHFVA